MFDYSATALFGHDLRVLMTVYRARGVAFWYGAGVVWGER